MHQLLQFPHKETPGPLRLLLKNDASVISVNLKTMPR